jgi:hypothetical protein
MAPWIVQSAFGPRVGHEMLAYKQTRRRWAQLTAHHFAPAPYPRSPEREVRGKRGSRRPQESLKLKG